MKKRDITIESKTKAYNETNNFNLEKKYDEARFVVASLPTLLFFEKPYAEELKLNSEYERSSLRYYKKGVEDGKYSKLKDLIEKETMETEFIITKKGKEKIYKELKVSDYLVEFLKDYDMLKRYNKNLSNYQKNRYQGVQQFFMLEYGDNFKHMDELEAVRFLVGNTDKAIKLIEKDPKNFHKAKYWLDFLEDNIKISRSQTEYNIVIEAIDEIPEFSEEQFDIMEKYSLKVREELAKTKTNQSKDR